jgi:hypothetical protein
VWRLGNIVRAGWRELIAFCHGVLQWSCAESAASAASQWLPSVPATAAVSPRLGTRAFLCAAIAESAVLVRPRLASPLWRSLAGQARRQPRCASGTGQTRAKISQITFRSSSPVNRGRVSARRRRNHRDAPAAPRQAKAQWVVPAVRPGLVALSQARCAERRSAHLAAGTVLVSIDRLSVVSWRHRVWSWTMLCRSLQRTGEPVHRSILVTSMASPSRRNGVVSQLLPQYFQMLNYPPKR